MNLQRIAVPLLVIGLLAFATRQYGWPGFLAVSGGLVFWLLLHWTRMLTVMQRAARRPIGHVDSAVMFNARLKPGVNLMHVIAMTRSLGERLSAEGEDPERYRWTERSMVAIRVNGMTPVGIGVAAIAVCPAANSTVPAGTKGRTAERRSRRSRSGWRA